MSVKNLVIAEDGHTLFDVLEFFYRDQADPNIDYDKCFKQAEEVCEKLVLKESK